MSSAIEAATDAIRTHIGGFRPTSGQDLHGFFQGAPDMLRELGQAFSNSAEGMTDEHIHPAVLEMMRELGQVISGTGEAAEQVYSSHVSNHDLWLKD